MGRGKGRTSGEFKGKDRNVISNLLQNNTISKANMKFNLLTENVTIENMA